MERFARYDSGGLGPSRGREAPCTPGETIGRVVWAVKVVAGYWLLAAGRGARSTERKQPIANSQ